MEKEENNSGSDITISKKGVILNSYDDLWKFSQVIHKSGDMCPKHLKTPESILVAIQAGLEISLSPMQSIHHITIINGIPCLMGDMPKSLVLSSNICDSFEEYFEGDEYLEDGKVNDDFTAVCITKRRGAEKEYKYTFSVKDAKAAGLMSKDMYKKYLKRMLMFRARGFNLRDNFTDVLKGMKSEFELADYTVVESRVPKKQNKKGLGGMSSAMDDED